MNSDEIEGAWRTLMACSASTLYPTDRVYLSAMPIHRTNPVDIGWLSTSTTTAIAASFSTPSDVDLTMFSNDT